METRVTCQRCHVGMEQRAGRWVCPSCGAVVTADAVAGAVQRARSRPPTSVRRSFVRRRPPRILGPEEATAARRTVRQTLLAYVALGVLFTGVGVAAYVDRRTAVGVVTVLGGLSLTAGAAAAVLVFPQRVRRARRAIVAGMFGWLAGVVGYLVVAPDVSPFVAVAVLGVAGPVSRSVTLLRGLERADPGSLAA